MRFQITSPEPDPELRRRVADALAAGELVALPTETVYGIAARADRPAALERLAVLKRRPERMAWTWHVGDPAAAERFPRLSPMARRLVERYWPGPLTLVLPGVPPGLEAVARDGWTGVRCVAHELTASLLRGLEAPVVMTSVNLHGDAPALDARAIEDDALGAGLELIVDSGPAPLQESSTVLKVGPGHFDLLREGLHDLIQLRSAAGLRIGFACTGNTCRSPMAEGLARRLLARRLAVDPSRLGEFGFEFSSMGVFASSGAPASTNAVKALEERDIELSDHRSTPVITERISELDRVYCMTRSHLDALHLLLPPGKDGNLELLDPQGDDVPDPIGGSMAEYRRCAQRIAECLDERLEDWA